jgi:hypothetical protein
MNRRDLIKSTVIGGLGAMTLTTEGCTLASALTEADNILIFIAPLGDGAAAIIEIADPAIAPAVAAAAKIYDLAVTTVEGLLKQWAAASASAQPGILAQVQAAVVTLQADASALIAAAQVKAASTAAEIGSIFGAITSEISALLTVIPQIGALGGTTAALNKLTQKSVFGRGNLYGGQSAKSWRSGLVTRLSTPTGQPMDTARVALATTLKGLELK